MSEKIISMPGRRAFVSGAAGLALGALARSPAQAQPAELKIGLIAPMSGGMARQGYLMKLGAQMAIEDVNAQGGIAALNGAKLQLVMEDAGGNAETAENAAQLFVSKYPDAVAGTGAWSSSLTLAVTEITERARLPWITVCYADKLTARGFKYLVQTSPVASALSLSAIPTTLKIADTVSGKTPRSLAIVSDSTAASQAFVTPLRHGGAEKLGLKLVVDEVFSPPLSDATPIIQKLRAARPELLLFYATEFPDSKLVLSAMSEFGLTGHLPVVSVGVQLVSPEMLAALGPQKLEGLINYAADWSSEAQKKILPDLVKRSGEPWIGQDTIATYGDIWLIKSALEKAGSTDHDKVMEALKATNTTEGPAQYYIGDRLAFDANGRRVGGAVGFVQWQGGYPYLVSPDDVAMRPAIWPTS